jgi:hypothetical protein
LIRRYFDILTNQSGQKHLAQWLRTTYLFFVVLGLYKTYTLALHGRYISFPIEEFALPVIGILGLLTCQWLNLRKLSRSALSFNQLSGFNHAGSRDHLIAYALTFAAIAMVIGETIAFMDGRDFIQAHAGFSEGQRFAKITIVTTCHAAICHIFKALASD